MRYHFDKSNLKLEIISLFLIILGVVVWQNLFLILAVSIYLLKLSWPFIAGLGIIFLIYDLIKYAVKQGMKDD